MFGLFGIYTRQLSQQSRTLGETGDSGAHNEHIRVFFFVAIFLNDVL